MASADLELQQAVYTRLTTFDPLSSIVAGRVFDRVPSAAALPYVTIGDSNFQRQDGVGLNAGVIYLTLQAWSDKPGYPEVKAIADAVETALHEYAADLPSNRLVTLYHRYTNTMREPDGLGSRAVMNFAAYTEKPANGS